MPQTRVTVWCFAYNHEHYIRECLEGFVMQKTDFSFKVVVHDDASTDGTADIIREYELKHPDIFKPIYQTKNQFSQKVNIYSTFILPQIEGDYVALCEGDDCWTDPNKLQMQVDWLDSHPECSACGHNAKIIKESDLAKGTLPIDIVGGEEGYLSVKQVIRWGHILHANTLVYRSKFASLADWVLLRHDMLDYLMSVYLRLNGEIYRFGRVMSLYRYLIPGSWTARTWEIGPTAEQDRIMYKSLKAANKYSNGKYNKLFARNMLRIKLQLRIPWLRPCYRFMKRMAITILGKT